MKNIVDKIKNIDYLVKYALAFLVGIVSSTWFVFSTYNNFNTKLDKIHEEIMTTKQMALKSIIWSEEIKIEERAKACDIYLSSGYNSYTKKKCEKILNDF